MEAAKYRNMPYAELERLSPDIRSLSKIWLAVLPDDYPEVGLWAAGVLAEKSAQTSVVLRLLGDQEPVLDVELAYRAYRELRMISEDDGLYLRFWALFQKQLGLMHSSLWGCLLALLERAPVLRALLLADEDGAAQMLTLATQAEDVLDALDTAVGLRRSFWQFLKEARPAVAAMVTVWGSEELVSLLVDPELAPGERALYSDRLAIASELEDQMRSARTAAALRSLLDGAVDRMLSVPSDLFFSSLERLGMDGQAQVELVAAYLRAVLASDDSASYVPEYVEHSDLSAACVSV